MEIDLLADLIDIVGNNKRHKYYKRVTELATQYRQILTNMDTDDMFRKVVKREDDTWFEQRKRLTNLILMPLSKAVLSPLKKVARSNDLQREIKFENDGKGERTKEFTEILNHFNGKKSLDNYMRNRFLRLSDIDPNAWIVIEWPTVLKPTTERVRPYPFEVRSSEAIDFLMIRNELQYLCCEFALPDNMKKYIMYGKDYTLIMTQLTEKQFPIGVAKDGKPYDIDGLIYIAYDQTRMFVIEQNVPHNLGYVPAIRTGYHTDEYTDDTTFINTFHCSLPYFLDSVKAKSEKDLSFALHNFPIRIQQVPPCPECNSGKTPDGKTCSHCNGTGNHIPTTTQDVITFALPRQGEQMVNLENVITFVRPPVEIIDAMITNLDALEVKVWNAVWSKDANTASEVQNNVTATEKNISESAKFDNLFPCAEHLCEFWTFTANTIAKVTNLSENLTAWMSVGKEFSIKSKDELTAEYKVQKESGMTPDIYRKTERDIVRIDYATEPGTIRKYEVRQRFMPFSDKSADQINVIITDKEETTLQDRVLWKNYESVWDTLEMADPKIYEKNDKEIKTAIDKEVNKLIAKIKSQQAVTGVVSFAEPGEEGAPPMDVEAEAKAKLKGTVGGVTGIIEINTAVSEGRMSPNAAKTVLIKIYGFTEQEASAMVELPLK